MKLKCNRAGATSNIVPSLAAALEADKIMEYLTGEEKAELLEQQGSACSHAGKSQNLE